MIAPGTQLSILVVRLSQIVVSETQARYPERVLHYVKLLSDPAHKDHYAGVVHLAPYGVNTLTHEPLYTLLDGHHRLCASILAGRENILAVLHIEPSQCRQASVWEETPRMARETVTLDGFDDYETLALMPAVTANGR